MHMEMWNDWFGKVIVFVFLVLKKNYFFSDVLLSRNC